MKGELQLEPLGARNPSDSDPLLENQHDGDSPSSESPSEIKNEDIEAGSVACCRICLECDSEEGWTLFWHSILFDLWWILITLDV